MQIFNNIAANRFFEGTVLAPRARTSLISRIGNMFFGASKALISPLRNVSIYSDSDQLVDFCFVIACASALSGRRTAFITPTPQDFSLALLRAQKGADAKQQRHEELMLAQNLYIANSSDPLMHLGFELAVVCPASAYEFSLNIPRVLGFFNRSVADDEYLVHFRALDNCLMLSSASKQFGYMLRAPKVGQFEPNKHDISPEALRVLSTCELAVRMNTSRAQELSMLASCVRIEGADLALRESCVMRARVGRYWLPIDLGPLNIQVPLNFQITNTPSF